MCDNATTKYNDECYRRTQSSSQSAGDNQYEQRRVNQRIEYLKQLKEKLKEKTHLARCVELVAECFYFKFIQSQEELDNILLIDFIKKTIFYISGQMSMYKNTQEFMLNSTPFDVIDMMVDYFYSC